MDGLIQSGVPRSQRFAVFGWTRRRTGWQISIGRLNLVWNRQPDYTELALEWIKFDERMFFGWRKTLWLGKSSKHVDENRPDKVIK